MTKQQQDYLQKLSTAPNHTLLAMYVEASIPDDYDGGFTTRAEWELEHAREAFFARLIATGYMTEAELKESGVEDWF